MTIEAYANGNQLYVVTSPRGTRWALLRLIVERIKRLIFQKGNKCSELKESAIDRVKVQLI